MAATATDRTDLDIRKITGRVGAEIVGLNLSHPLDPDTVVSIRAALTEHKALVFRRTGLDDKGPQRFAGYFGHLTRRIPPCRPSPARRTSWPSTASRAGPTTGTPT